MPQFHLSEVFAVTMDGKSLAKSKRAHSQHHSKKPHSVQKSKLSSSSATVNEPANSKKQIRDKTHHAERISALPSNWNRYDEEFDSISEDPNQAPDIILPKCKGADFRYLISEAESQLQSNPYSNTLSSLDDVLPGDFNRFVGSMLAVRGEGILSWTGNDNFVVDESTTATHEASFLSLNLHALAEQLEKVDLSERLFIEEDILPADLRSNISKANNDQDTDQMQVASSKKEATKITEELTLNDLSEKVDTAAKIVEDMSSGPGSQAIDAIWSNKGLGSMAEVYGDSISGQRSESGETRVSYKSNSTSVSNRKVPAFEAAAAEAELDMLLNSSGETEFLDISGSSDFHRDGSSYLNLPQDARKGIGSLKTAHVTSSFDGLLDDLLQETSTTVNRGTGTSRTAAVDSTFDDLLQETSTTVKPTGLSEQKVAGAGSDNRVQSSSSQPASKSQVLNDFDSWLDTI